MNFPKNCHWPAVVVALLFSAIVVAGGAFLLARGVANPPRAKHLLWQDTTLAWAGGTARQPVGRWYVSPKPLSTDTFSLEVVGTLYADTPTLS